MITTDNTKSSLSLNTTENKKIKNKTEENKMSRISEIGELIKNSVLVAIKNGYTIMRYGTCKCIFVYKNQGIIAQIEVNNELEFDEFFDTRELSNSLELIYRTTAFIIAHNRR